MTAVVGRERELANVEGFLTEARTRLAVLLLEGEAGIGKTTVWREVVRRAEEGGFRVLSCRPAEAEAKLALSAVADLLRAAPSHAFESLPAPQRRALEVALLQADPQGVAIEQRLLATAVQSTFAALSTSRPLLLAIDDVQWLDGASAEVLAFVLRRLGPERIGVLASRRLGSRPRFGLELERVADPETLTRVKIGPLSVGAIHQLLKRNLALVPSRPTLIRIHTATAGNPLFALEIGRILAELGPIPAGEPLPIPDDLVTLVRRRLGRLPDGTREVLLAAAALGNPREEVLAAVLGRAIDTDLEPAGRLGIAWLERGAVRFEHPLFGAAFYAAAPVAERRRLHRRLAEFVSDSEERARHLALSIDGPDEAVANALLDAAREALLRGAPIAAVELAESAVATGLPQSPAQARRILDLAAFLYCAAEPVRARRLLETIDDWSGWPAPLEARARGLLLELVSWTDGAVAAAELGERLLEGSPPAEVQATVRANLSAYYQDDLERAAAHADAALSTLDALGSDADPGATIRALAMLGRQRLGLGHGLERELIDRVLGLEAQLAPERWHSERVSYDFGKWFKHVDDLASSREWLTRHLVEGIDTGDELLQIVMLVHLSLTECWAGELQLAHDHIEEASRIAAELGDPPLGVLGVQALVEAHRGEVDAVYALAEELTTRGMFGPGEPHAIQLEAGLGLLELSLGNDRRADGHLRAALEAATAAGHREPGVFRLHANAAEAAVGVGELDRAEEIATFLEEHGQRTGRRSSLATGARVRALIAASRGDLNGALGAAEESLAAHEGLPMPFERARTLLVRGVIERRARQRTRASASLEEAASELERMGARAWAERARGELARVGLRRSSGSGLTESERRVAGLAASGLTNREVAAALFISPKTVESNLARVYAKLGIASRAELGARKAELEPLQT